LQQQLVIQQKQQEDAQHQHYALIDKLRIDLEKEREEKQELIIRTDLLHQSMQSSNNINRNVTESSGSNESVNFIDTFTKSTPSQKSTKSGSTNIETQATLPMTSQNSSKIISQSLDHVNHLQHPSQSHQQ
jgi:hypothetical protein